MAYFPLFINLKNKNVLIIGGGSVAYRKIKKILPFEANIHVIAKEIKEKEIFNLKNKIYIEIREFRLEDLENKDIVINATNDINLQKLVYEECIKRKIPVNSVDSPDYCSFLFPAYIKEKDVIIGISTSGKAPILSRKLKTILKNCLPKNISDIVDKVFLLRKKYKGKEEKNRILRKFIDEHLEKIN